MNNPMISVYYNKSFGIIIVPLTKLKGSIINVMTQNVLVITKDNLTLEKLSAEIRKGLNISKRTDSISRDEVNNQFWKVSQLKTYNRFNKEFSLVNIEQGRYNYTVEKFEYATTGGYDGSGEEIGFAEPEFEKAISVIFQLLDDENHISSKRQFKTLNNNQLSYSFNYDNYDNLGDGHTDAYQIYADNENRENLIAFMIDSGYDSFEPEEIRKKFAQYFGELQDYDYRLVDDSNLHATVHATSDKYEIQSYLFKDGDGYLEVQYQIDRLHTPEPCQIKLKEDFEKIIQSIEIRKTN